MTSAQCKLTDGNSSFAKRRPSFKTFPNFSRFQLPHQPLVLLTLRNNGEIARALGKNENRPYFRSQYATSPVILVGGKQRNPTDNTDKLGIFCL
jgi:hypothetical protein